MALQRNDLIVAGKLYRRVYPDRGHFPRGVDQPPSTQAFEVKSGDPGVSVYLADFVTEDDVMDGHDGFALISVQAEVVVGLEGFSIRYEPKEGERPGKGHSMIYGPSAPSKRREISRASVVLRPGDLTRLHERFRLHRPS
jgi:hypothetical protein